MSSGQLIEQASQGEAHGEVGPALFACPRCGKDCVERFFGPCVSCRAELVAAMSGVARNVERSDFEPHAHVVANHVATKD